MELLQERLRLEILLEAAIDALQRGERATAEGLAQQVLERQPDNVKAGEIRQVALEVGNGKIDSEALAAKTKELENWLADTQRTTRLDDLLLKWPSVAFWEQVSPLREQCLSAMREGGDEYIQSVVRTSRIHMTLENAPISKVLRQVQAQTALDAQYEASKQAEPSTVTMAADDLPLSVVLQLLSSGTDLKWKVAHGGIWFFHEGDAKPVLKAAFYDVRDLVVDPSAAMSPGAAVGAYASGDAVAAALLAEVDPDFWKIAEGASTVAKGSTLVVKATALVHAGVKAWLEKQRKPK